MILMTTLTRSSQLEQLLGSDPGVVDMFWVQPNKEVTTVLEVEALE